jgi:hypothetical protein
MSEAVEVTVPGGYELRGAWLRSLWLRSWQGCDEMLLCERGDAMTPAAWTTSLLARCVSLDGGSRPAGADFVRSLTVGDREALLLHLRRITLGGRMSCVFGCPACAEKMDLDLEAAALLLPPYAHDGHVHRARMDGDGAAWDVAFRLPNGGDQEAAAALVRRDEQKAVALVLRRCIQSIAATSGEAPGDVPPAVARALPGLMSELDPQAEMLLDATCPSCHEAVRLCFDAGQYLLREVAQRAGALFREVHLLASQYHWSESEILAMTAARRRRYLEVIGDAPRERRPQ